MAAIRTVPVMVLIFTNNANASDEIKKEVAIASLNRVTVIPVRMKETVPSDAFAYELATRQWIDVSDDWEESLERLIDHLKGAISAKSEGHVFQVAGGAGPAPAKEMLAQMAACHRHRSRQIHGPDRREGIVWYYATPQLRATGSTPAKPLSRQRRPATTRRSTISACRLVKDLADQRDHQGRTRQSIG